MTKLDSMQPPPRLTLCPNPTRPLDVIILLLQYRFQPGVSGRQWAGAAFKCGRINDDESCPGTSCTYKPTTEKYLLCFLIEMETYENICITGLFLRLREMQDNGEQSFNHQKYLGGLDVTQLVYTMTCSSDRMCCEFSRYFQQ